MIHERDELRADELYNCLFRESSRLMGFDAPILHGGSRAIREFSTYESEKHEVMQVG